MAARGFCSVSDLPWQQRRGGSGRLAARRHRSASCRAALIGIDLGTSNSAVAAVIDGKPTVLADRARNRTVPSVVAYTEDDLTLVGWDALEANAGSQNTFYSFKRLMGQKLEHVASDAARLLYTVTEGDRGEALVYSSGADGTVSPEELSAEVLRHLVRLAEQALQERVTGAVVTVPAHFNQQQKGATQAAAQLAGLPRTLLLQEPVAAALAHGIGGSADGETVLVFDLGGGTFDVSVLQAFEGIMEVLGTAGDSYLGGDDFDAAIASWLLDQLTPEQSAAAAAATSTGPASSSSTLGNSSSGSSNRRPGWEWAVRAAEQAKLQLAQAPAATIELPGGGGCITLSRQTFEQLTAELFQRMAEVLQLLGQDVHVAWAVPPTTAAPSGSSSGGQESAQHAEHAGVHHEHSPQDRWAPPPRRISRVVLVGQSTRLPSVQGFVEALTGIKPTLTVDPAEAVALGAAVHAGMLLGEVGAIELMDGSYSAELHGRATGWEP